MFRYDSSGGVPETQVAGPPRGLLAFFHPFASPADFWRCGSMVANLEQDSSPLLLLFAADIIAGCTKLLSGYASDMLGMATRPVVLLGQSGFATGTAESFATGGVLTGLMGTFSVILLAVGVGVTCGNTIPRTLTVLAAAPYLIDGLAQLPQLIFPNGSVPLALASLAHYPASQTGFPALLQIAGALAAVAGRPPWALNLPEWLVRRLLVLHFAICLRYSAADLLGGSGPMAQLLMAVAAVNVFYCLTPSALWQQAKTRPSPPPYSYLPSNSPRPPSTSVHRRVSAYRAAHLLPTATTALLPRPRRSSTACVRISRAWSRRASPQSTSASSGLGRASRRGSSGCSRSRRSSPSTPAS